MSKVKILYINYSMHIGGIERMIVEFARSLIKQQVPVEVAVFETGGELEKELVSSNVVIHNLCKKEGFDWGLIFKLRKLIATRQFSVIHTNNFNTWIYGALACIGTSVRVIHTEHSNVEGNKKRRFFLERFLVSITDTVVTVSKDVKERMLLKSSIDPDSVKVIVNGIDTDHFVFNSKARHRILQELKIPENAVVLGSVGRLMPVKDHETMIKAFKMVADQRASLHLVLVGDGELRESLQSLIAGHGLNERVHLLGARRDIPELLSVMNIYLVSSLNEGMSLSILEAMSVGLPVIATRVGGNPELVEHNVTGLLVAPSSPSLLADAINQLLSDKQLADQLAKQARHQVEAHYSQKVMLQTYQALYTGYNRS